MSNNLSVSDITPLGERPADVWRGRLTAALAGNASLVGITFGAEISVTLGASVNDWAPSDGGTSLTWLVTMAGFTVTGIAADSAGSWHVIKAVSAGVIAHESASSSAANRITCPGAANLSLATGDVVIIEYVATTSRWQVIAGTGAGTGLAIPAFATPSIAYGTPAAGAASTVIRSDATIAKPTAADVDFSANVTTNNVSITAHGLAPILPNDATKYLDGTGAYTVPAGGGGGGGSSLSYVEFTSTVNLTATTEGTATTIVTSAAVAYDGATVVWIECFIPELDNAVAAEIDEICLYDGASSIGLMSLFRTAITASSDRRTPHLLRRRLTPSAATHTYSIRGFGGGHGSVTGGAGGSGNRMPGYISITKA